MKAYILLETTPFKLPVGDADDVFIGVNGSGVDHPVHWEVVPDWKNVKKPRAKDAKLFTTHYAGEHAFVDGRELAPAMKFEDLLKEYSTHPSCWTAFGASAALVLAAKLGATEIIVLGLDREALVTIDGRKIEQPLEEGTKKKLPVVRHDLGVFFDTVKFLEGRGVEVTVEDKGSDATERQSVEATEGLEGTDEAGSESESNESDRTDAAADAGGGEVRSARRRQR